MDRSTRSCVAVAAPLCGQMSVIQVALPGERREEHGVLWELRQVHYLLSDTALHSWLKDGQRDNVDNLLHAVGSVLHMEFCPSWRAAPKGYSGFARSEFMASTGWLLALMLLRAKAWDRLQVNQRPTAWNVFSSFLARLDSLQDPVAHLSGDVCFSRGHIHGATPQGKQWLHGVRQTLEQLVPHFGGPEWTGKPLDTGDLSLAQVLWGAVVRHQPGTRDILLEYVMLIAVLALEGWVQVERNQVHNLQLLLPGTALQGLKRTRRHSNLMRFFLAKRRRLGSTVKEINCIGGQIPVRQDVLRKEYIVAYETERKHLFGKVKTIETFNDASTYSGKSLDIIGFTSPEVPETIGYYRPVDRFFLTLGLSTGTVGATKHRPPQHRLKTSSPCTKNSR